METKNQQPIVELTAKELCIVSGAGDHTPGDNGEHWEDIGFNNGSVSGNLGMVADGISDFGGWLNDLGRDLGGWAFDMWG